MADPANTGIYEIVNLVNGKRYIGSSLTIPKRWKEHRKDLQENDHHSIALQRAWLKYGSSNFQFLIIENCPRESLLQREQAAFDLFKPEYNTCKVAGSPLGLSPSKETRAKLSAALRGRLFSDETRARISAALKLLPPRGPEVYARIADKNRGRKASIETKKKLSIARKGKKPCLGVKHSDAFKAGCRQRMLENNPFRGKKHSPETRAKISAARIGKGHLDSELTKAKKSLRMRGNTLWVGKSHSQETKDKLRAMFLGRIFSAETKKRMSESQRRKAPASAETRAKMSASRSGLRNGSAIKVPHTIEHVDGRRLTDIPMELRRQSGLSPAGLCQLMSGQQKSAKGWRLVI